MAWADVNAKLALWATKKYYMTNGAARLIADFGGKFSDPSSIPDKGSNRAEFEARLDYYLAADDNLAASVAWTPEMLRKV